MRTGDISCNIKCVIIDLYNFIKDGQVPGPQIQQVVYYQFRYEDFFKKKRKQRHLD